MGSGGSSNLSSYSRGGICIAHQPQLMVDVQRPLLDALVLPHQGYRRIDTTTKRDIVGLIEFVMHFMGDGEGICSGSR